MKGNRQKLIPLWNCMWCILRLLYVFCGCRSEILKRYKLRAVVQFQILSGYVGRSFLFKWWFMKLWYFCWMSVTMALGRVDPKVPTCTGAHTPVWKVSGSIPGCRKDIWVVVYGANTPSLEAQWFRSWLSQSKGVVPMKPWHPSGQFFRFLLSQ